MPDYVIRKDASFSTLEKGNAVPLIRGLRVIDLEGLMGRSHRAGDECRFISFFDRKKRTFPTGLLGLALRCIKAFNEDADIEIKNEIARHVELGSVSADILPGIELYPWQLDVVNLSLKKERGTIIAGTGGGKTLIMLAMMAELLFRDLKVMIVVPTTPILAKTVKQIKDYLDVDVGMYGGKTKKIEDVTVITNQSLDAFMRSSNYEADMPFGRAKVVLSKDEKLREYIEEVDAVFVDEVHLSTAPAWYRACMSSNAWFRIGLTGTLDEDSEVRMMRLKAATGDVLIDKKAYELIEEGHLSKPYIHAILDESIYGDYKAPTYMLDMDAVTYTRLLYEVAVVNNRHYNSYVADLVEAMFDRGWAVLVTCQRRPHFQLLMSLFESRDIEFFTCWGDTPLGARVEAMETIERQGSGVILATKIFDLGVDIPALDAVVLTGGGKAQISIRQRVGRGLRAKKGKENIVHIFDFMDSSIRKLAQHSVQRWEIYESEKFDIIPEEDFAELLKSITDGSI